MITKRLYSISELNLAMINQERQNQLEENFKICEINIAKLGRRYWLCSEFLPFEDFVKMSYELQNILSFDDIPLPYPAEEIDFKCWRGIPF